MQELILQTIFANYLKLLKLNHHFKDLKLKIKLRIVISIVRGFNKKLFKVKGHKLKNKKFYQGLIK